MRFSKFYYNRNIRNNKIIKWLLQHSLTIISCVLITALGAAFLVWSSPGTTTIGENISTGNITASGNLEVGGSATTTGDLTVSGDLKAKTGRTATIAVAASDSSTTSKQQADYICDGVDDEIEIKAAMDALPAQGGKVVLLDGTYYIYHTLYFSRGDMIIEGQGDNTILRVAAAGAHIFVTDLRSTYAEKTSLTADAYIGDTVLTVVDTSGLSVDNKIIVQRNYVVDPHIIKSVDSPTQITLKQPLVSDFYSGNKIGLQDWYENIQFLNMKFYLPSGIYDSGGHGLRMITVAGKYMRVANCVFVDDSGYSGNTWPMVFWGGGTYNVYVPSSHITRENNILINCGCIGWGGQFHTDRNNRIIDSNGESFVGDVQHSIIEGNILIGGTGRLFWSNETDYNIVKGNIMVNCADSPIYFPTGDHTTIIGNTIINANGYGITLGATNYMDVMDNHIYNCKKHGIYAAYGVVKNAKISGNTVIDCGKLTANTYDGILVGKAGTLDCVVSDNLVRKGTGNTNKYGIEIGAGTSGIIVRDNDLRDSGVTANFVDAGTSTIVKNNRGYNPVGVAAITVGASPFTYTAGASPVSVYVSGGTVTSITKAGTDLGLTSGIFELEPYESIVVTYSATPTMIKDVH